MHETYAADGCLDKGEKSHNQLEVLLLLEGLHGTCLGVLTGTLAHDAGEEGLYVLERDALGSTITTAVVDALDSGDLGDEVKHAFETFCGLVPALGHRQQSHHPRRQLVQQRHANALLVPHVEVELFQPRCPEEVLDLHTAQVAVDQVRNEQVLSSGETVFGWTIGEWVGVDEVELAIGQEGTAHEKVEEVEGGGEVVEVGVHTQHPAFPTLTLHQEVHRKHSTHSPKLEGVAKLPDHAPRLRRCQRLLREGTGHGPEGLPVDLLVGSEKAVLAVGVELEGDCDGGEMVTRAGRVCLDDAALLDEAAHEVSVGTVDGGGSYLETFVQVIADVVAYPHSHFLVLRFVMHLRGEGALLVVGVVDCVGRVLLLRSRALMALEAPRSAQAMPLPLSSSSILRTQVWTSGCLMRRTEKVLRNQPQSYISIVQGRESMQRLVSNRLVCDLVEKHFIFCGSPEYRQQPRWSQILMSSLHGCPGQRMVGRSAVMILSSLSVRCEQQSSLAVERCCGRREERSGVRKMRRSRQLSMPASSIMRQQQLSSSGDSSLLLMKMMIRFSSRRRKTRDSWIFSRSWQCSILKRFSSSSYTDARWISIRFYPRIRFSYFANRPCRRSNASMKASFRSLIRFSKPRRSSCRLKNRWMATVLFRRVWYLSRILRIRQKAMIKLTARTRPSLPAYLLRACAVGRCGRSSRQSRSSSLPTFSLRQRQASRLPSRRAAPTPYSRSSPSSRPSCSCTRGMMLSQTRWQEANSGVSVSTAPSIIWKWWRQGFEWVGMQATLLGLCCRSPILEPVRMSTALGWRRSKWRERNWEVPGVDRRLGSASTMSALELMWRSEVRSFLECFSLKECILIWRLSSMKETESSILVDSSFFCLMVEFSLLRCFLQPLRRGSSPSSLRGFSTGSFSFCIDSRLPVPCASARSRVRSC